MKSDKGKRWHVAKLFLSRGESPVRVNEHKLPLKEAGKSKSRSLIFKIRPYKLTGMEDLMNNLNADYEQKHKINCSINQITSATNLFPNSILFERLKFYTI